MSRHRNIRSLNIDDGESRNTLKPTIKVNFSIIVLIFLQMVFIEYEDFNAVVGSLDEQECISPTDANQYLFDRARGQSSLNTFLENNDDIPEDDEEEEHFNIKNRRDSENYQLPELNDIEKAKLMSCMEEIRNIIGDSSSDKRLVDAIMINNYDFSKALDMLLNSEVNTSVPVQFSKKPKVNEVEKGK